MTTLNPPRGGGTSTAPAPPDLTPAARERLLRLARTALAAATGLVPRETLASSLRSRALGLNGAAFVTLLERGELRGCMGFADPSATLERAVVAAATSAALDDVRFLPLRADELADVEVEISILGPTAPLEAIGDFVAGDDGIVVAAAGRRAFLLPQVATEHGLDAAGMLSIACRKAGLAPDAWHDRRTELRVFHVARFAGPAVATTGGTAPDAVSRRGARRG